MTFGGAIDRHALEVVVVRLPLRRLKDRFAPSRRAANSGLRASEVPAPRTIAQ